MLYLASVALQMYMAGLALFGVATFISHALLGYLMILGAVILLVLTVVARRPRSDAFLAVAVLVLAALQPVLALTLRTRFPVLAALHPVNALVIFVLAARVGRATALAPPRSPEPSASSA